jgi:hypothetical protein
MPASGIRRVEIVDIAWIIKYVGSTLAMQGGAQRAHPTDMGEERVFTKIISHSHSSMKSEFSLSS